MTCIIALKTNNKVYIGGDRMASNSYSHSFTVNKKIFKNGDFYFGYTSSFYMGQLLMYSWSPPARLTEESDNHYIFVTTRNSLVDLFSTNQYGKEQDKDKEEPSYGTFIFVYKNRIFHFQSNTSILEYEKFCSVGCGSDAATGALIALLTPLNYIEHAIIHSRVDIDNDVLSKTENYQSFKGEPELLIQIAIYAAAQHHMGVSAEADIICCE